MGLSDLGIIVGIVLGLIGTSLSVYNSFVMWRRNREHLKVELSLGGISTLKNYQLIINVINDGSLPLTLVGYGIRLPDHPLTKTKNMRLAVYNIAGSEVQFPHTLPARDKCGIWIDLPLIAESLRQDYGQEGEVRLVAYVDDAVGRNWNSDEKSPFTIDIDKWAPATTA